MSELSEHPEVVAKAKGLVLVLPEPNQIFLDIDSKGDEQHLAEMLECLIDNGEEFDYEKRTVSPGGNLHVYLRTKWALDPLLRVALQACLGSDRKRELLSLLRIVRKYDIPASCFFETPVRP